MSKMDEEEEVRPVCGFYNCEEPSTIDMTCYDANDGGEFNEIPVVLYRCREHFVTMLFAEGKER